MSKSKHLQKILASAFLAASGVCALQAQSISVPVSAESFEVKTLKANTPENSVKFGDVLGRPAVDLPSGFLHIRGASFRDGRVEFDVASKPKSLFLGIGFRVKSEANMEVVYLRPSASDTTEAVQYTPRLNGDAIWQLLNSSHEKASAHLPDNEWIHVRLEIRGRTCALFLNENKQPTLFVTNLRRGDSEGGLALWALGGGGGYFSNISYEAYADRKPLAELPRFERPGLLSEWELSPALDASEADSQIYPTSLNGWDKVYAEEPGFVLVNRYRTSPAMFPMPPREEMQKGRVKGAKLVFARTHIASGEAVTKTLTIGYSDDIVVYLNRRIVFSGKNALSFRMDNAFGTFGMDDRISVELDKGDNELLVAVTEYNGGWAFECDLSPVS